LDNSYSMVMIPSEFWSFELIESWFTSKGEIALSSDFESASGLAHYPATAGAYFAARLAVSEHLEKRKRKAAILVLREIRAGYVMPMGVWQIREGVREALKSKHAMFDTFETALQYALMKHSVSKTEIINRSRTHQE